MGGGEVGRVFFFFWGGGRVRGGQGGFERRIKVFLKIKKKIGGGGSRGGQVGLGAGSRLGVGFGCNGGCERRIEVFVKIQKQIEGGVGGSGGGVGFVGGSWWM